MRVGFFSEHIVNKDLTTLGHSPLFTPLPFTFDFSLPLKKLWQT